MKRFITHFGAWCLCVFTYVSFLSRQTHPHNSDNSFLVWVPWSTKLASKEITLKVLGELVVGEKNYARFSEQQSNNNDREFIIRFPTKITYFFLLSLHKTLWKRRRFFDCSSLSSRSAHLSLALTDKMLSLGWSFTFWKITF